MQGSVRGESIIMPPPTLHQKKKKPVGILEYVMPKCRYLGALDMPHGANISQHHSLLGYVSLLMGPLM
jgi:hypothetical protein